MLPPQLDSILGNREQEKSKEKKFSGSGLFFLSIFTTEALLLPKETTAYTSFVEYGTKA